MTPVLAGLAILGSFGGTNSVVTSLHFDGQNFVIKTAQGERKSPISPDSAPSAGVVEKKGTVFAVWDARGLTVRDGDWSFTSRLEDAALSPKLFNADEIRATRAMIEASQRKREASDLAGTTRLGDRVYWLPRWRDAAGKPWLEVLYEVNLAEPRPKPRLVGRLQGFAAPSSNALGRYGDSVFAITRDADAWGFAFYTPVTEGFGFLAKGDRLVSAERVSDEVTLVAETTPYDTTVVRRLHLPSGQSRTLAEIRGRVEFVNARPPVVDIQAPTGRFLRNLETGAEKRVSPGTPVRWVDGNVLVWSPAERPSSAVLWNPERWKPVAQWTAAKPPG